MFSATAIANFLACQHTLTLNRAESRKEIRRPFFKDPTLDLLRKLGLEHEQCYLRELAGKNGVAIVEIDTTASWEHSAADTLEALRRGADVVYQGTFLSGQWGGRSDFLLRVEKPSALGNWSYEPVETKLARRTKAGALIQLCFYSELLSRIQGLEPQWMHVVLGDRGGGERFLVQRYIAYFRKVRKEFEAALAVECRTYPEPVEHCDVCPWFSVCDARWRTDDNLALVAGITRSQRKHLCEHGVTSGVGLAELGLPVTPKIQKIGEAALLRIHEQARLQVEGRERGQTIYELLEPPEADRGLCILPPPSPGDLFLDLEANPYVLDNGLEYLIGSVTLPPEAHSEPQYQALWSFDRAQEKNAFETFIGTVMERWAKDPAMHIYHYAPYEPTAIKRLAGRHDTCVDEVDEMLRAELFVDLYRAVRQGLRASVESYSIKRLEPLYHFTRTVPLREANIALNSYEAALVLGNGRGELRDLLGTIEAYNHDDCVSALRLRDWLETQRDEFRNKLGRALPRPLSKSGKPGVELASKLDQVADLKARLLKPLPANDAEWTDEQRARGLLAQLLEWHRREEKSAWWEYYRLCELSDEELLDDNNALGGLVYVGEAGRIKKSIVYRYQFPPQDHSIDRALDVRDPRTKKGVGDVLAINERDRTIDIKRSAQAAMPHPTALVPFDFIDSNVLKESLLRVGEWVARHGIRSVGSFQAARNLLLSERPHALKTHLDSVVGPNGHLTEHAKRLVLELPERASVLPIQGPPGTGKTFTAARMIAELVRHGLRVGISAVSHKVISNVLREMCLTAAEWGVQLSVVQKANEDDGYQHTAVNHVKDNRDVLDALTHKTAQVAAGTAFLWARSEMAGSIDVLFVDEAAQMSLANVIAMSPAATSLVLLGDPQQLEQPQRGIHPPGAEVSSLGHLLSGRATIVPDQGLFLTETRRLHPDLCRLVSELFYEGRLVSRVENANQRLNTQGLLDGTGIRFVAVNHSGNQSESEEEVQEVAALLDKLLATGATWTNKNGETRAITIKDILIVAPYNAQVSALAKHLPAGARVGTVDKFQGQEAPLVFYSMATSTPDDAPRGMEFLYSLNRLNVAISRARCVATIVASPALFDVQCRTPRQIELANAFCRLLEAAQVG
jgi:predicted RecB family nuclease